MVSPTPFPSVKHAFFSKVSEWMGVTAIHMSAITCLMTQSSSSGGSVYSRAVLFFKPAVLRSSSILQIRISSAFVAICTAASRVYQWLVDV